MPKRNKALDAWLDNSKRINAELAEDPEARAAAEAQAGETQAGSDDEAEATRQPDAVETTDTGDADASADEGGEDEAARAAAAEADRAAREQATRDASPTAEEDARERELANLRQERDRLKREREEAKRQSAQRLRELQQLQAERSQQPAPVTQPAAETRPASIVPDAKDDPAPDKGTYPVEYGEWLSREAIRRSEAADARAAAAEAKLANYENGNAVQNQTRQFESLMEIEKENFKTERPDFDDRLTHVKNALRRQMQISGIPAHEIESRLQTQETQFLAQQVNIATQNGEPYPGAWALERLYQQAEVYGYRPGDPAAGTEAARTAPAAKKPAPTAQARVADGQRRATAARAASTMSGTAAETFDPAAPMTAERFLRMSWAEREQYKKAHPNTLDRIMSEGEEHGGVNPLLVGR